MWFPSTKSRTVKGLCLQQNRRQQIGGSSERQVSISVDRHAGAVRRSDLWLGSRRPLQALERQ
jgi:hypothetical protein